MNKATKQLLEENNQREKELSPDNQKVLTDIVAYLRGSSTPILQQEQVRRDITEMLLAVSYTHLTLPTIYSV